jgi:glyoxylase-like metal-dependent hydrolase (beta-lactamase superfamily II)
MTPILHKLTDTITAIDLQFQSRPNVIASYLFHDGKQAALIETGPASTVETLIAGVQAAGVPLEALRQLVVTHIHLDHAGAAGALTQRHPWMRVYVHPVGAPHLADPSKLIASAARLYGDQMEKLWGAIQPVPTEKITIVNDGDEIKLPGATLRAFATPGHARHHHAYLDANSGLLFTGDVAGVRIAGARYVRPPTPPPELDIEAWRASIAKLCAIKAAGLCPTHFGVHRGDVDWHWDDLERRLVSWGELVRGDLHEGLSEDQILERMKEQITSEMNALGVDVSAYDVAVSYKHVVAGYLRYWNKKMVAAR